MDQLMNVILTIYKVHTALQRVLDCVPGLGGLNQVYGPNHQTCVFTAVLHMYYMCMNYMCNTPKTTHVLHMYLTCKYTCDTFARVACHFQRFE